MRIVGNIYGDKMRIKEFYERYNIDEEAYNFVPTKMFNLDLKQSGCKSLSKLHEKFNDLNVICTNPNFYTDGTIIAESRKSIIQASGHPIIKYKGKEYWEIDHLVKIYGDEAIKEMNEWEWLQIMDWIVVEKKTNKLLLQFDSWENLPIRKEVE